MKHLGYYTERRVAKTNLIEFGRLPSPGFVLLIFVLVLCSTGEAKAQVSSWEKPTDGQEVFGGTEIKGWAFSQTPGVTVTVVTLFIDGLPSGTIPCCAARPDILFAFPGDPPENTLNSGFKTFFDFGSLALGLHDLVLQIDFSDGLTQVHATQRITVIEGPPPIPTLPQWGIILLTLSLLAMATWRLAGRHPSRLMQDRDPSEPAP